MAWEVLSVSRVSEMKNTIPPIWERLISMTQLMLCRSGTRFFLNGYSQKVEKRIPSDQAQKVVYIQKLNFLLDIVGIKSPVKQKVLGLPWSSAFGLRTCNKK